MQGLQSAWKSVNLKIYLYVDYAGMSEKSDKLCTLRVNFHLYKCNII